MTFNRNWTTEERLQRSVAAKRAWRKRRRRMVRQATAADALKEAVRKS